MHKDKIIAHFSNLLSDIATEITQTCSTRDSVLNIYLGSGLPQLQLDLFKPILLENYAFLFSFLTDEEVCQALELDVQDMANSLELEPRTFQKERVLEYAHAKDKESLYTEFCMFTLLNRANASSSENLGEDSEEELSSNTLVTLQLGAKRMREAAEQLFTKQ